jgi:filamentous hemagglutinin family protein
MNDTLSQPGLWLRTGQGQRWKSPVIQEQPTTKDEEEKAVVCRVCLHRISTVEKQISVDGAHTHTFFNPAGIVFEIICFSMAPGCAVYGNASSEFSWFSGFTWRLALCANCRTHLGWFFESSDSSFFGLILKKLSGNI